MSTGFKLSFASAKTKNLLKPTATSSAPPAKRPRLALDDEEPEDKDKSVEISGFDASSGGAIDLNGIKKVEAPRVIPVLPNRNVRPGAERRAQDTVKNGGKNSTDEHEVKIKETAYGLTIVKKAEKKVDSGSPTEDKKEAVVIDDGLTDEQRLEKRALDALLNGKTTADQTVIPVQSEEEAFERDFANAPDAPTLDAYEATPIEGFGAALLRGMGWKDGEEIGRNKDAPVKRVEVKRRPALLGIGAKPEAAVGIELGSWNQGKGKGWQKKEQQAYNPVVRRNKFTGEVVTEEELKAKLEQQSLVKEDRKERRDKYEDDDYDEKRRERRRKEKRDRRDRSEGREERERDRGNEKERERRRDDDGYYDSDRRKDRRRDDDRYDRRRDDDYDDERRREKRRERERRDRSRSRDSGKRRRDYDGYDDDRDDRKKRHRDDKYYRK